MKRWLLICLFGSHAVALAADDVSVGCNHLHLVLDSRLNSAVLEREWSSGHPRSEAPAVLELRGCTGQLLDHMALDAPLARLDPAPLRGTPFPTYLLSVDLTAEAGSYNGPLTTPIQVANNHLVSAVARAFDGKIEAIHLASTGKAAWKKVFVGRADDLLSVSCKPQDHGFHVIYQRYHPTRQGWQVRIRSEPGFWESDGEFPATRQFPKSLNTEVLRTRTASPISN